MQIVALYFLASGQFDNIVYQDRLPGPQFDPLYAVWGMKKTNDEGNASTIHHGAENAANFRAPCKGQTDQALTEFSINNGDVQDAKLACFTDVLVILGGTLIIESSVNLPIAQDSPGET